MAENVTTMRLKVDLQCEKCYKKVKKALCKFPEIREQVFDEKKNIVTIKVVCCSPEKMRDKLCCKACGAIISIEIVKPTPPEPPTCRKTPEPKPPPPPVNFFFIYPPPPPLPPPVDKTPKTCCVPCCDCEGRPCRPCCPPAPKPKPLPLPEPVPSGTCCVPCSEGRRDGPCFEGCRRPPPCYEGCYYGRPVYDSCGGGRPCYVSRCDQYFNEDNATGCTVM